MYFPLNVVISLCLFLFLGAVNAENCGCDCFPVNTIDVTIDEAGNAAQIQNLDNVCLNFSNIDVGGNALVRMYNTYSDGKPVLKRASIQVASSDSTGSFLATGPTRTYKDIFIGSNGDTVVIYRCRQTGTCVTNSSQADVVVYSTNELADEEAVNQGMDIARENFPNVNFSVLPRNKQSPCEPNEQ